MKKIYLFIIAVSLSSLLQAQQTPTREQQKVQQTVIDFFETLSNRDSVRLLNFCTADIALFEYGEVWTLDTLIRKAIRKNTAADFKRINTIEFLSSSANKNTAWTTYKLRSEITRQGKKVTILWLETVVMVKDRKRWKIKVLHSTRIV